MPLKLLCISAEPLLNSWRESFESNKFECFFARGKLRVKQILQTKDIQCIFWQYTELQDTFAQDIVDSLNEFLSIPIVIASYQPGLPALSQLASHNNRQFDLYDNPKQVSDSIKLMEIFPSQENPKLEQEKEIVFRHKIKQTLLSNSNRKVIPDHIRPKKYWLGEKQAEKTLLSEDIKSVSFFQNLKDLWNKK